MNGMLVKVGITALFLFQNAHADALKKSLSGLLHEKETTHGMVNLDALGMTSAKRQKKRSPNAIVAVADGIKIKKRALDSFLKERTQGKVSDFDKLLPKQKKVLVGEYILPRLFAKRARAEIPRKEQDIILSKVWVGKATATSKVSDETLKKLYEKIRSDALAKNPLSAFPPFEKIKPSLKAKVVEQRLVNQLLQSAPVTVAPEVKDGIVGHVGMLPVTKQEAEEAARYVTKGKAGWDALSAKDKERLLKMLAPSMLMVNAARNNLEESEIDGALANIWMRKKLPQIEVSEKEITQRYKKLEKLSKKKLPPLEKISESLKLQIAKEKLSEKLLKNVKITLK